MQSDRISSQKVEKISYDHFFIFVCNIPNEERLNAMQKEILNGMMEKWKKASGDEEGKRIHFMYCDPSDKPEDDKFKILNEATQYSLIYLVGHCAPGSDELKSDPIYTRDGTKKKFAYGFPSKFFGQILLTHLDADNRAIILPRYLQEINADDDKVDFYQLASLNRRLRVCIPSCFSATDKLDEEGQVVSPSFASRVLLAALNHGLGKFAKFDVQGARGYIAPIPTEPYFFDFAKFLLTKKGSKKGAFHERYWQVNDSLFLTSIPRHKPSNVDYKPSFIISPYTTLNDVHEGTIGITRLTTQESKYRLKIQIIAERLLSTCNDVLANGGEFGQRMNLDATFIRDKIITGTLDVNTLLTLAEKFPNKVNQRRYLARQDREITENVPLPEKLHNKLLTIIDNYLLLRESPKSLVDKISLNKMLTQKKLSLAKEFKHYLLKEKNADKLWSLVDDFIARNKEAEIAEGVKRENEGEFGKCLANIKTILLEYKQGQAPEEKKERPLSLRQSDD